MINTIMAQMRINALVKEYDKRIKKCKDDLDTLYALFNSANNDQLMVYYHENIVKTNHMLNDLKQGREYYEKNGKICKMVASF